MRIRRWIKDYPFSDTIATKAGHVKYFHDIHSAMNFIQNKDFPRLQRFYGDKITYAIHDKPLVYKDGVKCSNYAFLTDVVYEILDDLNEEQYDLKDNTWEFEGEEI